MAPETSNADTAIPPDKTDGNAVFVGRKGVMDHVMAIMTRFNKGADDVVVDAVEITRNRYMTNIKTGMDEVRGKRGDMIRISWIELFVSRT